MASIPPPDRPTEPLRPVVPGPVVHERVVAAAVDPNLLLVRLQGTVDSLRSGLVIVGVLAVAAVGLAIYALLNVEHARARNDLASNAQVSQLQGRIDALSRQIQSRPGGSGTDAAALNGRIDQLSRQIQTARPSAGAADTAALGTRVAALESKLGTLASRPTPTDPTQALAQLSSRVDAVVKDVAALKAAPPAPAP